MFLYLCFMEPLCQECLLRTDSKALIAGGFHDKATRRCVSRNSVSSDRPRQRSKVIIQSDHQRREMNSVFRQVGGIIVTLQLSSFDLSLDIVLHDLFV